MASTTLLALRNLHISFQSGDGLVDAVNNVSFSIYPGKTLGLVGESGSGKSVTALSLLRLLPGKSLARYEGQADFKLSENRSVDLNLASELDMQHIRGKHIGMIFQEPMTSLNPVKKCGGQVAEVLLWHKEAKPRECKERVLNLFREVNLPEPEKTYQKYPHELSGGQRQRVMIAMAIACKPKLLIADEPTTALDVTVQKGILKLLKDLQNKYGMAILFISHDLGVIKEIADELMVMQNGCIVEHGSVKDIFENARHPYTKGLIACRPPVSKRPVRLPVVGDFVKGTPDIVYETSQERENRHKLIYAEMPILQIKNLNTSFITRRNIWGKALARHIAVQDVSFDVFKGETLGLAGESGCGKTTLGRTILRLIESDSGQIIYKGQELTTLKEKQLRKYRPRIQIIFQDPYSSLTPGIPIGEAIAEPMKIHGIGNDRKDRETRIYELLEKVGLKSEHFHRYPHEFSGGQRQRVCIARALALEPDFIVCDESVSALDVSVQAQVLNLLNQLKKEFQLTYIFISHDLSVVKYFCDRVLIMSNGQIVEQGEADKLFHHPQTDYARNLIEAVLHPTD